MSLTVKYRKEEIEIELPKVIKRLEELGKETKEPRTDF